MSVRDPEKRSAYNREYRLRNLEQLRAKDRDKYHADIETARKVVRDKARKRREADPDLVNQEKRERLALMKKNNPAAYLEMLERDRVKQRERRAACPDDVRAADRVKYRRSMNERPWVRQAQKERRIAHKKLAPGRGISAKEWRDVLEQHGGRCAYCGRKRKLTMDHVVPLSRGGAHDVDNVVAACDTCNKSKNDTSLVVWLATRARL